MLQCPFDWMRPNKVMKPHVFREDFDLEIDQDEKFGMIKRHVGKVYEKELQYASFIEEVADNLSKKLMGSIKTPWWDLLIYCIYIHIFLTMLVCFMKTDFINLTIVLMLL